MALTTVTGIVTRYTNYKDNDRILTIFTRERGRMDACARGCRRPKSQLMPCAQPFVYGEFQMYEGKDRNTVNQCDVQESFYPLREDVERLSAGYAMLALAQAVIQENLPSEGLFSSLYYCLSFLSYADWEPQDAAITFMARFLDDNGYRPALVACAGCGTDLRAKSALQFSSALGGALCPNCAAGQAVSPASSLALEALRRILRLERSDLQRVRLPVQLRLELLRLLQENVEHVLGRQLPALQKLRVMADAGAHAD